MKSSSEYQKTAPIIKEYFIKIVQSKEEYLIGSIIVRHEEDDCAEFYMVQLCNLLSAKVSSYEWKMPPKGTDREENTICVTVDKKFKKVEFGTYYISMYPPGLYQFESFLVNSSPLSCCNGLDTSFFMTEGIPSVAARKWTTIH